MNYKLITVDNIDIPFNNNWNDIAISLSGGADSALLSYILCEIITKNNTDTIVHIISHIRMWKTKPWQGNDSLSVYNWLLTRFPNIKFKRHTNFISPEFEWGNAGPTMIDEYGKNVSGDNIEIRAFAEYTCYHENVSAYYNAVTRNPKNVSFKGMDSRDIDPTDDNMHLTIMMHMDKLACHPFRFVDKKWIIDQYKNFKITDLLDITRSCEGEFKGLDYRNYKAGQYVPTCSKCFWCKEREWAIDQQ